MIPRLALLSALLLSAGVLLVRSAWSAPTPPGPVPDAVGVDTASTWYLRNVDGSDPEFQSTPQINQQAAELMEIPDTGDVKRELIQQQTAPPE